MQLQGFMLAAGLCLMSSLAPAQQSEGNSETATLEEDLQTLRQIISVQQSEIQALKQVLQAALGPQGAIRVDGKEVIDDRGQWVGDRAGLRGEPGPQGPKGPKGERGPAGDPAAGRQIEVYDCQWSQYVNDMDQPVNYSCQGGRVMMGTHSYHDSGKEDRRFKFHCCKLRVPRS